MRMYRAIPKPDTCCVCSYAEANCGCDVCGRSVCDDCSGPGGRHDLWVCDYCGGKDQNND
jgi:hypothetical protein